MMNANEIIALKDLLASPKNITIIPHRNPDGDAMGSTLGLYHFLKQLGHKATVIAPNDFPSFLAWLPNSENVLIYEKETQFCQEQLNSSDLVFTLDFNALHRTGDLMERFLSTLDKTFVMIDHHQLPDSYAFYKYSDTSMSSTCEMVYHFIHHMGYEKLIDSTIATCIYTGLVTDTGSFRFSSTTSTTHEVASDLIKRGIKNAEIHNNLFDTSSYNRLQLLGKALQNMQIMQDYKTSYITLTQEELNLFSHQKGDTEGFVNYGLSIKGIDFTAIFIENKEEGIIKISFRSQGDFDVNQFARKYFNGGGHLNAAGGKSTLNLEETVNQFISIVKDTRK
ncbi:DHH family phosphoesterase [Flavobacterium covae]|uniref:Bifunctional oligoribonuclease/PAP phosphatase NrnA n=1 Tax=Flavobacterium covae TaxID=2906076 RepID=A0ABW8PJN3_9FLAO|nr:MULTISPECIES: bifunctional oligoribonuclease/PAP phosphatase NrnA [Flavobacterium]OWP80676.1 DHH family phosphoesterase [Flavobacterium covae]POR21212.1 DHH family phosphoesterase [Flavobacterium columnare]